MLQGAKLPDNLTLFTGKTEAKLLQGSRSFLSFNELRSCIGRTTPTHATAAAYDVTTLRIRTSHKRDSS